MKSRVHPTETLSVFLAAVCLGLCLLLPQRIGRGLALAAAYTVWPESGVYALRRKPASASAVPSVSSVPDVAVSLPDEITQTPQDILQWMDEARANAVHEKKDGDIRSQTFGKKSSTDTCRGLLIRNVTEDVQPNFGEAMDAPLKLRIDRKKPAVLIYHTHTSDLRCAS